MFIEQANGLSLKGRQTILCSMTLQTPILLTANFQPSRGMHHKNFLQL